MDQIKLIENTEKLLQQAEQKIAVAKKSGTVNQLQGIARRHRDAEKDLCEQKKRVLLSVMRTMRYLGLETTRNWSCSTSDPSIKLWFLIAPAGHRVGDRMKRELYVGEICRPSLTQAWRDFCIEGHDVIKVHLSDQSLMDGTTHLEEVLTLLRRLTEEHAAT